MATSSYATQASNPRLVDPRRRSGLADPRHRSATHTCEPCLGQDGENPKKSTFLRYINHSVRRANCRAEEVVDTDYSGPFAAVAVVAERDIAKGEELMFDCARRF